jgi:hypothetical protein
MLSRTRLLRYALVALVSAFAATATVGGAVLAHNDGFNERIMACFESRDANSDQCLAALEVSPVDADFFAQLASNLANMPARPEPQPKTDLYSLVKACAESGDLNSDECLRALDETGLSVEELQAKIESKFGCVFATFQYEKKTCGKRSNEHGMTPTIKECLALKASLNGRTPDELAGMVEKINSVCRKAIVESGLTPAQFWAKYR